MEKINSFLQIISVGILLFSLVYLLGIIWRTEMKLDKSYKFLFVALLFLVIYQILEFFVWEETYLKSAENFAKFIFAVFLFLSVFEARSMLREVDGENNEEK